MSDNLWQHKQYSFKHYENNSTFHKGVVNDQIRLSQQIQSYEISATFVHPVKAIAMSNSFLIHIKTS